MKKRLSAIPGLIVLCLAAAFAARAQNQAPSAPQQFAPLGEFKLQSGEVIHDFRLGYRTMGTLNAEKSNAVLWPTWLGGRTEDLLQFVGPGRVLDSGKYFVILVDAIGDGVSTSPSNSKTQGGMKFPQFTIRDMVESERRLVTEVLHLSHLRAVMGVSMGGMQTFEWVLAYPGFMDVAIPIAGSTQSTSYDKLLWTAEIHAIELDPAWNKGNPTGPLTRGPALLEEIGSMNLTSPDYRVAQTSPKDFESFLAGIRKGSRTDGGSAWDAIRQREAIIALDIPGEYKENIGEVVKRVRAKVLAIVSPEDHMVNPVPASEFARALGAPLVQLDSACGHLSETCISVGPIVAQFLADPSSVQSTTLRDSGKR
jgi:homoserine O-acetyltransferase/O-succinyltransferase